MHNTFRFVKLGCLLSQLSPFFVISNKGTNMQKCNLTPKAVFLVGSFFCYSNRKPMLNFLTSF